jgi:hypothetical protein
MRQRDHRWLPFMKRRALIVFLAGVVAFPTIANAQLAKERRIGVLSAFGESDPAMRSGLAVFRQRLEELGWQGGLVLALRPAVFDPHVSSLDETAFSKPRIES